MHAVTVVFVWERGQMGPWKSAIELITVEFSAVASQSAAHSCPQTWEDSFCGCSLKAGEEYQFFMFLEPILHLIQSQECHRTASCSVNENLCVLSIQLTCQCFIQHFVICDQNVPSAQCMSICMSILLKILRCSRQCVYGSIFKFFMVVNDVLKQILKSVLLFKYKFQINST